MTTPADTPAKPKSKRLTPKQWAEAEALWESGEVTLTDLVAKFGIHKTSFQKRFAERGIKKGAKKEEHARRVAEEVTKAAIDEATVLAARIRETKEEHYKMAAGLAKLTWAEILAAKQNGSPMAVALNNLKALDAAMAVLKKAREERYAVLGLDREDFVDEDGLPELVISELTADQIEALRAKDHTEFDDLPDDAILEEGDNAVGEEEDDDDE